MINTTIDKLNHDCLVSIFRHLHPLDLIRAEEVCKQWQMASKATWNILPKTHDLEFVDFERPQHFIITEEKSQVCNLKRLLCPLSTDDESKCIIRSILKRCGQFFKSVTISTHAYDLDIFSIISEYCLDLEHLKIVGMRMSSENVMSFVKTCRKIVNLHMISVAGNLETAFGLLFANNPNLTSLTFNSMSWFTGESLEKIVSEKFETLYVVKCGYFKFGYLGIVEQLAKSLRTLVLSPRMYQPPNNLHVVSDLQNLRKLELDTIRSNDITDELLLDIYENCQFLESIEIVIGARVTDTGILALLRLPLLIKLELKDHLRRRRTVWTQGQYKLPLLQHLGLNAFSLSEEDICCLVDEAPKLKYMFLNNCSWPTSETTKTFVREVIEQLREQDVGVVMENIDGEIKDEFIAFEFERLKKR